MAFGAQHLRFVPFFQMCLMSTELIRLYMFLVRQNLYTKPVDACIPSKSADPSRHSQQNMSRNRSSFEGRSLLTPSPMSTLLCSLGSLSFFAHKCPVHEGPHEWVRLTSFLAHITESTPCWPLQVGATFVKSARSTSQTTYVG